MPRHTLASRAVLHKRLVLAPHAGGVTHCDLTKLVHCSTNGRGLGNALRVSGPPTKKAALVASQGYMRGVGD